MRKNHRVPGILSFAVSACLASAAPALTFTDPIGDTFGSPLVAHDITSISSKVTASDITFTVEFIGAISPPSDVLSINNVVGFIDIDADQDASTGAVSHQTLFSPVGPSDLGVEYYLDLFSEEFSPGFVDVVDTSTLFAVGSAPITFVATSFSVSVPLLLLVGDNGLVNYGTIVGDFVDVSDEARNPGVPPAFSVPEPSCVWLAVCALSVVTVACRRRSGP